MKRKLQAALEWIMTYGWAILIVLVVVGTFAYFGVFEKFKPQPIIVPLVNNQNPDIIVDSEPELQDICNRLVVNDEIYPFLKVMGKSLKNENNAQFVAYKSPAELRSDLDIFNVDGFILCGVPAELCYTENNDIKGGTYCILMMLEVPVFMDDFDNWYAKITKE